LFQDNRAEWQIVFIIAAVLFFVGNSVYLYFGTAVSQPWDAEDYLTVKVPELAKVPAIHEAGKGIDDLPRSP